MHTSLRCLTTAYLITAASAWGDTHRTVAVANPLVPVQAIALPVIPEYRVIITEYDG